MIAAAFGWLLVTAIACIGVVFVVGTIRLCKDLWKNW